MANPYGTFSLEQKQRYIQRCTYRRWERKKKLVDIKGSKCRKCNYDKCYRALTFHHRDPAQKSFALDIRNMASKSWEVLVAEINKCDLVCMNCHAEIEDEKETKYIRFHEMGSTGLEPVTKAL